MSYYLVFKAKLEGELTIPPSKSHTLRALLFASLAQGKSTITSYLHSPDTEAMIEGCHLLGANIASVSQIIEVEGVAGKIPFSEDVIHVGNSGIALRFLAAVGALSSHPIVITGDYSIRHQRPMQPLLDALLQLDVLAYSMRGDGYAPVIVKGPLKPGKATILGRDSQFVSALLIAGSQAEGPVEIHVEDPGEKPWVDLTLSWFTRLNIPFEREGYTRYYLPGRSKIAPFTYRVPGDLSTAAFPIAAALITDSKLTLKNVDFTDSQGDKKLIECFQKMGAKIEINLEAKTLNVLQGGTLHGIDVDVNDFIDGLPILATLCCYAKGKSRLYNGAIARHKESDRIHCMAKELSKMGAGIHEMNDGLTIDPASLQGAKLQTYQDHRLVMALTVAAMGAEGESMILNTEPVFKTYPKFAEDFNALGANIRVLE